MDWQNNMNQAMQYIEDHLTEDIDVDHIAKILHSSESEVRRLFSLLTNTSLSEYIRHRRLTRAIKDIESGSRITDIASLYGYESQAAFTRAFKRLHGITPSKVKSNNIIINPCPPLTFKLVLMEDFEMVKQEQQAISIIGSGNVGYAVNIDDNKEEIHETNRHFWDEIGSEVVGTTALPKYGAFISEDKLQLLGDIHGKRVLDIGCGSGKSMEYASNKGASEVWGLDISKQQVECTKQLLKRKNINAQLVCSPMEAECGLPNDYFDLVYSVYGIGWTTDLDETFKRLSTYLKKDGKLVFSWSHPIHKCVALVGDELHFKKSYFDDSWYSVPRGGGVLSLSDRMLSTYINALAKAGFCIEALVEESDQDLLTNAEGNFAEKGKVLPVTFVIKARKL